MRLSACLLGCGTGIVHVVSAGSKVGRTRLAVAVHEHAESNKSDEKEDSEKLSWLADTLALRNGWDARVLQFQRGDTCGATYQTQGNRVSGGGPFR
jgi:hypothetical protein